MLLQQIRTWTTIRTRNRIHRASPGKTPIDTSAATERACAAESDGKKVTWADATGGCVKALEGCSITASGIKEEGNDRSRPSKVAGLDPHPFLCLVRSSSNVSALMSYHAPNHIAVASCLPREDMWRPCEQAEQLEIPESAFLESTNEHVFHNPHDMLGGASNTSYAAPGLQDSTWAEERDKDILREYFQEPTNIVLHSDCPHLAPHIVITPAEDTPNDFYTPWSNRTLPQWFGFLMVPPYDLATGRLRSPNCHPVPQELDIQCSDDDTLVDEEPHNKCAAVIPSDTTKRVFCRSKFNSFVETTANERLIMYHVVKALQKHQCKAAAYAASARAPTFSRRYEAPGYLASIERPFVWNDPAEPLLATTKQILGSTLLESSCPFIAPHILISSPPPQNPWIPWHNAVNDPQDGRYLIVPSPRVNYINMDEDEGEEPERIWTTSSATSSRLFLASDDDDEEDDNQVDADYEDEDDLEVDHSESPPLSRPNSPGPETPTDDTTFLRGFFSVRRPNFVIDEDDEDDRALALAIAKNAVEEYYQHSASLLRVSLPVIEEEDSLDVEGFSPRLSIQVAATDEADELPPLDDWYLGVSAQTMAPTVAVA